MEENNTKLSLYWSEETVSIYHSSYLTLDLYQFAVFCELLNDERYEDFEKFYVTRRRPLHRNLKIFDQYISNYPILEISRSSLSIILTAGCLVSSVLMPVLGVYISRYLKEHSREIKFEIKADDDELQKLIEEYDKGYYGKGDQGLDWLFQTLSKRGYNISIKAEDIYKINMVLDKYSQRIVKTIRKY